MVTDPLLALTIKASFGLVFIVACLVIALLLIKIGVIVRDQHEARHRKRLSELFERYVRGKGPVPRSLLKTPLQQRAILQYVMLHRSFGESDKVIARILAAYEQLGLIAKDKWRLKSLLWWVRAEGARCLGQLKAKQAKIELLHCLADSALEVRLLGAWSLGRLGEPDTIFSIIGALAKDSRAAAMRLSSTVFEIGPRAAEPLIILLDHEDPAIRLLAVHLLAELRQAKALPHIVKRARQDTHKEVRIAAYKALGTMADSSATQLLIAALQDPLWEIRAQAARGLGLFAPKDAAAPLSRCLEDPEWWVRRNAGEALTKLGESGKKALLDAYHRASSQMTKEIAAQWLDELKSLPAVG